MTTAAQSPQGIRGPSSAVAGGSISIEVQDGSSTIEVSLIGDASTTKYNVGPDGKVTIPVPANSGGSFLVVGTVGPPPPSAITIPVISLE